MINPIPALFLLLILSLGSCSDDPIPKPQGYFRIELPEKKYSMVDTLSANFQFELPQYAFVLPSPDMIPGDRYWYNIYFPKFRAEVYLTYKDINSSNTLPILLEDLHKTAYGHSSRADNIEVRSFEDASNHKYGLIYDVQGNVASQIQFCITDSVSRFIRGSLYFACPPNKDSLAPVVNFLHQDVDRFIATFRWK